MDMPDPSPLSGNCDVVNIWCGKGNSVNNNTCYELTKALQNYGIIPEILGRLPVIARLSRLSINELEEVEIASITFATKKLCVVSKEMWVILLFSVSFLLYNSVNVSQCKSNNGIIINERLRSQYS